MDDIQLNCKKNRQFVFGFKYLAKISKIMAHNVPAVYEVGVGIKGLCEAKTAAANLPE
jgi:hypothetical protein